jgi:hypothetical protein
MVTTVGQRFVRRQSAARANVSFTTAADLGYDTAVLSEGGYGTWGSDEVTVDTAGKYLCVHGLGRPRSSGTARSQGYSAIVVNGTLNGIHGLSGSYYQRNTGSALEGGGIGTAILDLASSDAVGSRIAGTTYGSAVGDFDTNANDGSGIQLVKLPDGGDFMELERSTNQSISNSDIDATRPWADSSGTWTKITWPTENSDTGAWHAASSGDVTLPANKKFLICWALLGSTAENTRSALVARLNINSANRQYASQYLKGTANTDGIANGMMLWETGGSSETLYIEATQECNDTAIGTCNITDGSLQVIELNDGAEWIHVDNGTTNTGTTDLAGTSTWYTMVLSSTFRSHGLSDLSLDNANDAVQNDSGASMPCLAITWQNWDRDANTNTTRKIPNVRFNDGAAITYGWGGGYNRGNNTDNVWHSAFTAAALIDLANAADLTVEHQDTSTGSNADMGIYCSGASNRHMLGFQVLDISTLDDITASAAPLKYWRDMAARNNGT